MNLLSIRGGGSRGAICLKLLMEIEKITQQPISQLFDYFGGSSVGVLISSGILVSKDGYNPIYTAEELYHIFLKNISNCFTWSYRSYIMSGFGLFGSKYTIDGFNNIINTCCSNYKIKDLLKPVIFPAYDKANNKTFYFEKKHHDELLLTDVILSCTAAPTFFPSHTLNINDTNHSMIDSGLVVNDCSQLTYLKATKNTNLIDKNKILLLNLGTGSFEQTVTHNDGLLNWLPNIVNTLMNASTENELYELSLCLPEENYFVIDIPLDIKYYQLDNTSPDAIEYYIAETEKWINSNYDLLKEFCDKLVANKL